MRRHKDERDANTFAFYVIMFIIVFIAMLFGALSDTPY